MRVTRLPAAGLPPGGSPGDVLTRTVGGTGWLPPAVGGRIAYGQYRLNITGNSGDPNYLAVSEMALIFNGENVATGGTASATNVYSASYPVANAFDGDASTFWLAAKSALPVQLSYVLSGPVALTAYAITSPDQVNWTVKAWTLEGSNDGASWTVLHTVADAGAWTGGQTKTYTI